MVLTCTKLSNLRSSDMLDMPCKNKKLSALGGIPKVGRLSNPWINVLLANSLFNFHTRGHLMIKMMGFLITLVVCELSLSLRPSKAYRYRTFRDSCSRKPLYHSKHYETSEFLLHTSLTQAWFTKPWLTGESKLIIREDTLILCRKYFLAQLFSSGKINSQRVAGME